MRLPQMTQSPHIRPESGEEVPARIERARQGDRAAQQQLLVLVQRFARHVCSRLSAGWEAEFDAEDLAQESFTRLLTTGLGQYAARGSEESYLYALVRTTMLMRVRSAERRKRREEAALPEPASGTRTDSISDDRLQVDSILAQLDEACRQLLRRVFLEEVPYSRLASELALAEASVRSRVSRCLRRAREHV